MNRTVSEIIQAFGGAAAFSRVIGKQPSAASEMKRRGSIPSEYWSMIVDASAGRDFEAVTFEELVEANKHRVVRTDDEVKLDMMLRTWSRASDEAKLRFLGEIGVSERTRRALVTKPAEVAA